MQIIVILYNVRSTHNVGSIFRTADALAIRSIILTGTTPTPVDRFGRSRSDIAKVALGAEKSVFWTYKKDILSAIKKLKKDDYKIIAIEQSKKSVDYKKIKLNKKDKVVFVIGEEVRGISPEVLALADMVAEVPMLGQKESLNVSVAFGVALFRILNV